MRFLVVFCKGFTQLLTAIPKSKARFPRKKHRLPLRKAVLFSTFFCPDVENPVQF